jgi:hypothetical protein
MVGASTLRIAPRRPRALVAVLALVAAPLLPAQELAVGGTCRDGEPHGAYTLRAADGRLRVAGAFAKGRRTGTFLFWSERGSRVAVVPYDNDHKMGTIATWYAPRTSGGDAPRRSEAAYVDNQLHGEKRSWYPNGKPRTRLRYEHGELVEAHAFAPSGAPLSEAESRARAASDATTDEAFYTTLEVLVAQNSPKCEVGGPTQTEGGRYEAKPTS